MRNIGKRRPPSKKTKYVQAFILSCIISSVTFTVVPVCMEHKAAPIMAIITGTNFMLLVFRTTIVGEPPVKYFPIFLLVDGLCTIAVNDRFHFLLYFTYIIMTGVFIIEFCTDIKNIRELKKEEDNNALLD